MSQKQKKLNYLKAKPWSDSLAKKEKPKPLARKKSSSSKPKSILDRYYIPSINAFVIDSSRDDFLCKQEVLELQVKESREIALEKEKNGEMIQEMAQEKENKK